MELEVENLQRYIITKKNALKLDNYSIVVLLNQSHSQPYSLSESFKWNKNINISKRVNEDVLK